MAETKRTITLRIAPDALAIAVTNPDDTERPVIFERKAVRGGISMAANLREAFRTSDLLATTVGKALILVDAPVLMVPVETFEEDSKETLYFHAFPGRRQDAVLYNVLPDLNAVAVFAVNKDLRAVIEDRYAKTNYMATVSPVWRYLHKRSYTGVRNKLYGYFHDRRLEIFSFQQNRFKFCNSFETNHAHDALYFLLYVWKQLMLQQEHDEMHLVGEIPEQDWLLRELRRYLQKAYVINPAADFNRAMVTQIQGMPYDMMTLFVKGR